jgi:Tfp pilus assembly ATPase PilU
VTTNKLSFFFAREMQKTDFLSSGEISVVVVVMRRSKEQGCQIFLGTTFQNREKCTKTGKMYQNGGKYAKWP